LNRSLYEIEFLQDLKGRCPFADWFFTLKDVRARGKIQSRLNLLEAGHRGTWRNLGTISELKIDFGPGYRIYFGEKDQRLFLILGGGDKSTQTEDVKKAKKLWESCRGSKWRMAVKTFVRGILKI
jgi:putative addiction module killer protein